MDISPRQGLGQFFRALCDFLDERGLREQVRSQVSAPVQALMDRPPRPLAYLPSGPIDEVEAALLKLAGAEVCVEAGLAVARPLGWSLLQPVLRMSFQLFGQSPEPVFANLDRFFSMVTRGIEFSWDSGKREVLAKFSGEGTPEAAYHVLRGTLAFAFEVSGTVGEVSTPEVVDATPQLTVVRYRVSWR